MKVTQNVQNDISLAMMLKLLYINGFNVVYILISKAHGFSQSLCTSTNQQ
jgi:hypothetical protein